MKELEKIGEKLRYFGKGRSVQNLAQPEGFGCQFLKIL